MTLQHRNIAHRMIKRQFGGPNPGGLGGNGGNGGGPGGGGNQNTPTSPPSNTGTGPSTPNDGSTSTDPTSPSVIDTPSPTRTPPDLTSSQTLDPPTISKTTSSTKSSSSSSTASSTSTRTTSSSTSTSTFIVTAPAQFTTPVGTPPAFPTGSITSTTPSASASAAPSSGMSVGLIVGSIAGGLVGLAVLGILISFILRRMRKRNRRDTIIGDDFRNSQFFGSANTGNNRNVDNDILEPPMMAQHDYAPSIASGPGMAGHGAFQTAFQSGAPYDNAAAGYGATAYGAATQERPKVPYGQRNQEEMDDIAHGAYSSQPQPQTAYNPEAYGSYANYAGAGAGYQEATREYQGQHSGYAQGGYENDPFGSHGGYGVAVADPGPSASSTTVGAHPSAARDPAGLSGDRATNTRSVAVQDDDVYGGI